VRINGSAQADRLESPAAIRAVRSGGWSIRRAFRLEDLAAVVIALVRFAWCCYRAARQSVVIDEAYFFHRFLSGPWSDIYSQYDAGNHILYSILAKSSIQIFGLSEVSLRLPSLVAGFFLTLGIFHVLRLTTTPLIRWLAFIALILNPLLLDFSVAARGYGLSLAFLIWALDFAIRRRYWLCGISLGLAVSANLTIAFPAAGLMLAILLLEEGAWAGRFRSLAVVVASAETIFFAICFEAVRSASHNDFYFGYPTILQSVGDLVRESFHVTRRGGLLGEAKLTPLMVYGILPLIAICMLVALVRGSGNRRALFPFVTLAGAAIAIIVAHYAVDLPYPANRTGLHIMVLFGIAWAIAATRIKSKPWRALHISLAALLAIQFATQLHGQYFSMWAFDMRTKQYAQEIKRMSAGKPADSLSVSATWLNQPSLEFYRQVLNITALKPVRHIEPTEFSGHAFYVLTGDDVIGVDGKGIRIVFFDSRERSLLGVPSGN
jgi:4-amino-4-deoxy-L-arabinose transferase-like glycosyltransferase